MGFSRKEYWSGVPLTSLRGGSALVETGKAVSGREGKSSCHGHQGNGIDIRPSQRQRQCCSTDWQNQNEQATALGLNHTQCEFTSTVHCEHCNYTCSVSGAAIPSVFLSYLVIRAFILGGVLLFISTSYNTSGGFPVSSVGKESACKAGDPGLIPGWGRSAGERIGYPLQYSWASLVAQLVKNPPAKQETWVQSLHWEDPLEKGKATHSSILAWRIP